MDLNAVVTETKELTRARQLLKARASGMMPVKPSYMPELTDQECAALALQTDFTYDAIRKAFPKRIDEVRHEARTPQRTQRR